jgi:hypothetical protein
MSLELKGTVEHKLEVESGESKAGKAWIKQTLVINNGDQYNPNQAISFFGDTKVETLESVQVGQEVIVSVNLSSKEYNGKWYNQIDGWKVTPTGVATQTGAAPEGLNDSDDDDDAPF